MKNDGSFLEKLVQVIEQSLAPDSVVERNVQMPVLNSRTGETTQCDIVIRTGNKPRETFTIIEVQDRNRPVEINEFRGWLQKLSMVGAQHLYCVSRKEFPASIKEQAALTGGHTVKLITINQIEETAMPINFFKFTWLFHEIDIPSIKKLEFILDTSVISTEGISHEQIEIDLKNVKSNDKLFSPNKRSLYALSTFCIESTNAGEQHTAGTATLSLGYEDRRPLFFYSNGSFIPIKLKLEYTWTFKIIYSPPTVLSYDQNDHGTLAWLLETFYKSPQGPIWLKMPVVKTGEDSYSISGTFLSMPVDTEVTLKLYKITPTGK